MPMSADDYLASLAGTNNASTSFDSQDDDPKKKIIKPVKSIDADAYLASVSSGTPYSGNESKEEHKKRMQPILDRNAKITADEQAHSELGEQFGKSLIQGAGGALSGTLGTLDSITGHNLPIGPDTHNINLGIKAIKNHLDNVLSELIPQVDANRPLASTIAQGVGGTIGDLGVQIAAFKGAGAITGGIAGALEDVPLAQKAISSISKIAKYVGDWAETNAPNVLGNGVGGIVEHAIPNVAKAGIVSGMIDPSSLSTPEGVAKTAAMGLVGAAGDAGYGLGGFKDPNARPNPVDAIQYSDALNKTLDDPSGREFDSGKSKNPQPLTPEARKIQSELGTRYANVPGIPTLTHILGDISNGTSKFRRKFVNRNEAIKGAQESSDVSTIPEYARPANIAELNAGTAGQIDEMLENGPFTFIDGKLQTLGTPGLKQILSDVQPSDLGTLDRIITAGHKISKDDGTGDLINERMELRNAPSYLVEKAQQVLEYINGVTQYAAHDGTITPSMQRGIDKIFEDGVNLNQIFENESGSKIVRMAREVQGDLGQKRHSPIANAIEYTKRIVSGANKNKVWSGLADMADADPVTFNDIMRPASKESYANEFNSPLLFKWATELQEHVGKNIDPTKPVTELMTKQDALALVQLLHPQYQEGSGVITINRPTGPVRYEINPELQKYAESFSPQERNAATQFLRSSASMVKAGVTKEPLFMLFHGLIDNVTAATQSEHGYTFGIDYAKGLWEGIQKGESYQEWRRAGGAGGTLGDAGSLTNPYGTNAIIPKTGLQKTATTILHPLDALGQITKPIYTAAKLGEFMNIRKNFPDIDVQTAALASRKVTPDMMQIGGSMKFLASIAEFSNPAIQHVDNFYQAGKKNPKGMFIKGALGVTMPTVALWFANRNDEAIQELRKAPGGDRFWYVRLHEGDDGIAKLKKPYLLGYTFGTLPEQAMDKMLTDDPNTVMQAEEAFKDAFRVNMVPQAVQTAYGLLSNKQFFNDTPIIPMRQEGIDPQAQSTSTTSQLAKSVSNKMYNMTNGSVNISPIQLDFVLNHQFGTLGEDIGKASNSLVKGENTGPSRGISGMPMIGKLFASYPNRNVESINNFYTIADKVEQVGNTVKHYYETGNPKLDDYLEQNMNAMALAPIIKEARGQMSKINGQIYKINSMPDAVLSPQEKKELNDQYLKELQAISQAVNQGIKISDLLHPQH